MTETGSTAVARTIQLRLAGGWQSRGPITEKPVGDGRASVNDFVSRVFPGKPVEHLARDGALPALRWVKPSSLFFQGVHAAYANHHALGLRPEVLMNLINSVVAETVRRYPDDYRHLFTASADKETILVRHDGLKRGNPASPWGEAVALFDGELRKRVPGAVMEQMLPSFTTATPESTVASLVSFMDAASPYYDYRVSTLCGIPRIVLFGEPEDYSRLIGSAARLADMFSEHLGAYFTHLLPVLATLERTVSGGPVDEDFWSAIYKHQSMSGDDSFGGWLTAFLWYVKGWDRATKTDVLMVKHEHTHDWRRIEHGGISSGSEPSHVSSVPFVWEYLGSPFNMDFIGGVLGVDVQDGALTPRLSYGVLNRT